MSKLSRREQSDVEKHVAKRQVSRLSDYHADVEYDDNDDDNVDSLVDLGEIAILGSSRASLKYRSASNLNASRRSIYRGAKSIGRSDDSYAALNLLKGAANVLPSVVPEQPPVFTLNHEDQETDQSVPLTCWQSFQDRFISLKGYVYGITSAFFFSLSHVLMRRAKWLSGSDHAFIRYSITFIVLFVYMRYHKIPLFPKNKLRILFLRGFVGTSFSPSLYLYNFYIFKILKGSCSLISSYFALMFANPSDVVTLIHTSIVITSILSRIFFKEKLTLAHFVAVILSFIGILLICKPAFLFPSPSLMTSLAGVSNGTSIITLLNCTDNMINSNSTTKEPRCIDYFNNLTATNSAGLSNTTDKNSYKNFIGIGLSFFSAFAVSCAFCLIKKLCQAKVHWATTSIYVSWFGIPFTLALSIILISTNSSHLDLSVEQKDLPMDVFYSSISALLSLTGQICLNIAFKYEDATRIAVTKTVDVFFSAVLQYFILNIYMDSLNMMGALSILLGTSFVLLYKILESKYYEETFKEEVVEVAEKNNVIVIDKDGNPKLIVGNESQPATNNNSTSKQRMLKLFFVKI